MSDRCCFVCGRSSTNPLLRETNEPERFQSLALPNGVVQCLLGGLVSSNYVCDRFVRRDDFAGWPALPPSEHPTDRRVRSEA